MRPDSTNSSLRRRSWKLLSSVRLKVELGGGVWAVGFGAVFLVTGFWEGSGLGDSGFVPSSPLPPGGKFGKYEVIEEKKQHFFDMVIHPGFGFRKSRTKKQRLLFVAHNES